MLYFDTSYLARLYIRDAGWSEVRELAATDAIACCLHGQAETAAAFHRKFRDGGFNYENLRNVLAQFDKDCKEGAFEWLPLSEAVIDLVSETFARLPAGIHLRAADAIHLACAAENSITKIYSNDRRLIEGATYFGLTGINII